MVTTQSNSTFPLYIIDGKTVRNCLSEADCIPLMRGAMVAQQKKEVIVPNRLSLALFEPQSHFMAMPGALREPAIAGIKSLTLNPNNPSRGLPAIQGFITLFDLNTGTPVALIDAASITAIRTAAASGAASDCLAREDANSLALIGTGVQAESHLEALCAIRPIKRVWVWGRTAEKAQAFVDRVQEHHAIEIIASPDIKSAVSQADIVCTLTGSSEPILKGVWIKPGAHINLVGAHSADAREADSACIKRARVFVESKAAVLKEAGDLLIPLREQAITEQHILGEVGAAITGDIEGRVRKEDITLYKSLGNASQDLVAAYAVWMEAKSRGLQAIHCHN